MSARRLWISLLSLLLALTLVACSDGGSEPAALPPGASPSPEADTPDTTTTTSQACKPAPFAPTYLPWAKSGSIPEPQKLKNDKDIILIWFGPERGNLPAPQVDLTTTFESQATGEGATISVRGVKGELTWNPQFREMALRWTERDEPCGHYGLFFSDEELSDEEALDEMLRIKKSLE